MNGKKAKMSLNTAISSECLHQCGVGIVFIGEQFARVIRLHGREGILNVANVIVFE